MLGMVPDTGQVPRNPWWKGVGVLSLRWKESKLLLMERVGVSSPHGLGGKTEFGFTVEMEVDCETLARYAK